MWALGIKLVKSGQMCISLDHCLVPRAQLDQFTETARAAVADGLSDYSSSDSATGIISRRHFDRQLELVAEAREAGATVVQPDERGGVDPERRRVPFRLVVDPPPQLRLMREEVLGPGAEDVAPVDKDCGYGTVAPFGSRPGCGC